jgi:hypothetical protein
VLIDRERERLRETLSTPGVDGPACGAGEARAEEGSEGAGEVSKRLFFRLFASVGTAYRRSVLQKRC